MKKHLVKFLYVNDVCNAENVQREIFRQQDILASYYASGSTFIIWIIECNEEQLNFLVLRGAQIVPNKFL